MKIIIVFLFITFASLIKAGTVEGEISYIQAGHGYSPDNVYFLVKVSGTRQDMPTCAEPGDGRMAINPATEAGKVMLSMLLAANAANQSVVLFGSGDCSIMNTHFEDISYMRVN